MEDSAFETILQQIASDMQIHPGKLREQMQLAMNAALSNPDPAVQAMWNTVPSLGEKPTLEEFMEYLIAKGLLTP